MSNSDDDCDIFKAVRQRPPISVLPKPFFVPTNCHIKQTDYDFIMLKNTAKIAKAKPTKQSKDVSNSRKKAKRKQTKTEDYKVETSEQQQPYTKQHATPPPRELSPISQMIYEMEQKHVAIADTPVEIADFPHKIIDQPIAKRTRSSMGASQGCSLDEDVVVIPDTPTPVAAVPKKRGRKPKAQAPAVTRGQQTSNSTVSSIPARRSRGRPARATADSTRPNVPARRARRRQAVAEMAARAPVLDSIDLVSAVMPPIEGFVNLDSDEENADAVAESAESNAKTNELPYEDFDEENPLLDVNLWWLGELQSYKLRKHQKFQHMFDEIAKRNNVDVEDIVVNMDHHFIKPSESPQIINYMSYKMLCGRALKSNQNKQVGKIAENPLLLTLRPKNFQLKVQSNKWKTPVIIPMKKTETFKMLYIKCAEEINRNVQDIKLYFDGELLEPNDTPENQDMEGNEMIDLRFKD